MLDAGEPPLYIARRVGMAIGDIGHGRSAALVIANAAKEAFGFGS